MTEKKYYLTTPLYYVNAKPHIGHAYTNVLCDTFARYRRFLGEDVFFLTGTDEHGTKIEKAAREQSKDPRTYVDEMVPQFKSLWETLGIQYDYFIRTTDEAHKKSVQNILKDLEAKGEIYKASYKGWYCTPCESFWTKLQLKEGKCPDCGRDVQELSEENYFFKLSKYQDWLIKYIQENDFIRPEIRKNEILGFLREPLEDLCITRPRARLAWGIDYPNSKDHVVYVWFDALINYISAAGFMADDKKFRTLWPADLQVVGKDILRQHAVYWPIMLKACGVEMPKLVLAHGWWTMEGAKVSKSRGNAVDPIELVKKYSVDALRYFLMREVTIGNDGAFSEDLLAERYTSDLANDLGNLWFRFTSMLEKYFAGAIPALEKTGEKEPLLSASFKLWEKVTPLMVAYDPREALAVVWSVIVMANQFVEEKKPWVLAKDPAKKAGLSQALAVLGEAVIHIAVILLAFMPATAAKILERSQLPKEWIVKTEKDFARTFLKSGTKIERGEALFPRLEEIK
ncbi:MAG: methionine--tRNA ligase [Candidatus Omnitrophica bacterium]|nr:methionine--tRNA ligase [Candidatus Omnitrophota bacterium]